jgi:hypothetical protein
MLLTVENDVLANPMRVRLFRAPAVVPRANRLAQLVEQLDRYSTTMPSS